MALAYKKKDLYDDVRGCIREGVSIKETADLCGCKESTVRNWTMDIRNVTPRRKHLSEYESSMMKKDYESGELTLEELAGKYGYTSHQAVSQVAKRKGWIRRKGRSGMSGGIIAKTIDINEIEAIAERKARIEKQMDAAEEITLQSYTQAVESKPVRIKFRNMMHSFEGDYASYQIQENDELTMVSILNVMRLKVQDIRKFADELIEISNQYGGA